MLKRFMVYIAFVFLPNCSVEPAEFGGVCEITCSDAKIGSDDLVITPMNVDSTVQCEGDLESGFALDAPVLLQFLVAREKTDPYSGEVSSTPVPNVSIQPLIIGAMDGNATHPDLSDGTRISAARYRGIATSSEEWCSDTCGVAALEVQPLCIAGRTNTVTVQVHSGGAVSKPINLSIVTE